MEALDKAIRRIKRADSELNPLADAIQNLRGSTTVIMIAHRLSTVRLADQVFYFENGILKGKGKFDEVRNQIPNFTSADNVHFIANLFSSRVPTNIFKNVRLTVIAVNIEIMIPRAKVTAKPRTRPLVP